MSKLRFRVVESAFKKRAAEVAAPAERPSEYFGKNVFNREKMFKYLPEKAYARLVDSIDNGAPLDRETADAVAAGMKKWAIEMGVTHYTHWFAPLTEGTAEKHDAFVEHDGKGGMMQSNVLPGAGGGNGGANRTGKGASPSVRPTNGSLRTGNPEHKSGAFKNNLKGKK